MPRLAKKPCAWPGCSRLLLYTDRRYCSKHHQPSPQEEARREKRADPFYKRAPWLRLRLLFLRANPWCRECGRPATVVDHIKPIKDGGEPLDERNLQSLCPSCHSKKSAQECNRFGKEPQR